MRYQQSPAGKEAQSRFREKHAPLPHGDPAHMYYVYLWFALCPDRPEYAIYVGKGSNGRAESHLAAYRRHLSRGAKLDAKERLFLWAEDHGCTLEYRYLYKNLTEDEAFNLEREVMLSNNKMLLQRGNVGLPRRPRLSA